MILLTGFERFGNFNRNPSEELVKLYENKNFRGQEIKIEIIPVSFLRSREMIEKILEKYEPEIALSFGLASGRNTISIERIAINVMDSETEDNDHFKPDNLKIYDDGYDGYFSNLPVKDIVNELKRNNIPAYVSNSAGTYVCNTVMYSFLYNIKKKNLKTKYGFIHLPADEYLASEKNNLPYIKFEEMKNALEKILNFLIK